MEGLLVLAALAVLAIPVAVVVLLISVSRLKARVAKLERALTEQARTVRDILTRPAAPRPETWQADRPADESAAEPTPAPERTAVLPETLAAEVPPTGADARSAEPAGPAKGPWAEPVPSAPTLRQTRGGGGAAALGAWLRENWVYAISALSLALAGVFFVQYGAERGLLPPEARVTAALLFGLALVAVGEWLRRRYGDDERSSTAYLPSAFSGAGIVSIFAGVLAARQLYGLIGSELAFAGFVAAAALAMILGWFHGPFLAAFGLIGATAAPFLVGGDSEAPYWLYAYFALIAAAGLGVDTIRRWAWLSVLSLILAYAGGWFVFAGTGGAGWAALMFAVIPGLAICIPARGLLPDHAGAMLAEALVWKRPLQFPTLLAGGGVLASTALLTLLPTENGAESTLVFLCLAVLALALTVWSGAARAISDLTALPVAGFLLRLVIEAVERGPLARDYAAAAIVFRAPETAGPMTATLLLGLATAVTLAAAWASGAAGRLKPFWAVGAALAAPLAAVVLEIFWTPAAVTGSYAWALHVIALAALMVALATAFARADGQDRRRAAYATLSALSLIALALFLITTKGALTLALSALVVVAALIDRRFRLPEMSLFIQAGAVALSWRLIVDPGLFWAIERAALWEALASYGGAAAAMAVVLWALAGLGRRGANVFAESAGAGFSALLANVLLTRWLTGEGMGDAVLSHWALSLNATPWIVLMLVQLYRLKLGGALSWLRWAIAGGAGLIALGGLLLAAGLANPAIGWNSGPETLVRGPFVLDTLFVAYALPGLLLLAARVRLGHLRRWLLLGLAGIGGALVALYAGLEIRRFWRGDDLTVPGVTQAELYSYTIAMMVVGAGLLYQAIARRSQSLRRVAMAVIALTIAKVFLIDISGLTGLTRVFSFLALGLSLAGLAWLNRWAAGRQGEGEAGSAG
ncbi:hypothetical protein DEA8626_00379 [Defluviimonas aquaemixtae]|uniref:DUF2339 domain-containing protein n=1 Tax=Albidovulum aquaemixtae TaxID=1542388 RepID=A0A2R8B2R2_9RHOB|nr:DUF2339 domain-containing protein [Defluviimonas aquaemixtae]SPH16865.1 hypothetical protein DEA8626_00379 [Defluviimonas aquaemixtae]